MGGKEAYWEDLIRPLKEIIMCEDETDIWSGCVDAWVLLELLE